MKKNVQLAPVPKEVHETADRVFAEIEGMQTNHAMSLLVGVTVASILAIGIDQPDKGRAIADQYLKTLQLNLALSFKKFGEAMN